MAGTKAGGQKAKNTTYKKFGKDFYKRIGGLGGAVSSTGGFASIKVGQDGLTGPEKAKIANAKNKRISKRSQY